MPRLPPADPASYDSAPPRNDANCKPPLPDPHSVTASSPSLAARRRKTNRQISLHLNWQSLTTHHGSPTSLDGIYQRRICPKVGPRRRERTRSMLWHLRARIWSTWEARSGSTSSSTTSQNTRGIKHNQLGRTGTYADVSQMGKSQEDQWTKP